MSRFKYRFTEGLDDMEEIDADKKTDMSGSSWQLTPKKGTLGDQV